MRPSSREGVQMLTGLLQDAAQRPLLRACILRERGWLSYAVGDELSALRDLMQAETQLRTLASSREHMVAAGRLARVLQESGDIAAARKHLDASIALFRDIDAPVRLVTALTRRANAYTIAREYALAEAAAAEALAVATNIADAAGVAYSQLSLCEAIGKQQRIQQALALCDASESMAHAEDIFDADSALLLAVLRAEFSSPPHSDSALKGLSAALENLAQVKPRTLARAYAARAQLHAAQGDFQAAYNDQKRKLAYAEALLNADRIRSEALLRVQFETERSLLEKSEQQQQRERAERRVLSASMIAMYALIGLAALIYLIGLNRRYQRRLLLLAEADELTGLPNRRKMLDVSHDALQRASSRRPVALGLVDIDHFKSINDQYGHDIGDLVLLRFAELAKQRFGDPPPIGRYGGDEFLFVLSGADVNEARTQAEKLRLAVAAAVLDAPQHAQLRFTISVGIAVQNSAELQLDEVIRRCDSALYEAKRRGRNIVCAQDVAPHAPSK
jgi:diguanylate cyclase (GGDEF)-like protein